MKCCVNRMNGQIVRRPQVGDYLQIGDITDTFKKLKGAYERYAPKVKTLYLAATDKPVVEEVAPPQPVAVAEPQPESSGFGIGTLLLVGIAALVVGGMMRGR